MQEGLRHAPNCGLQLRSDSRHEPSLPGMEQTVGPYLLEAAWQHMLKEAGNKVLSKERADPRDIGLGVAVPERDLAIVEIQDVAAADGHAGEIGSQVSQGRLAAADRDEMSTTQSCCQRLLGKSGVRAGQLRCRLQDDLVPLPLEQLNRSMLDTLPMTLIEVIDPKILIGDLTTVRLLR